MAQVSFQITSFDASRAQLVVRFFNADIPAGIKHAVDLPMQNGRIVVLEGQALDDYVMGFCPMYEFDRVAALAQPTDYSPITARVVPEPAPPPPPLTLQRMPGQVDSETVPGEVTEL